jgi:drug/metabolite transporter (DMT)-like permease
MWLAFAFSGPVLWAISTHFDKYLVERYFMHSDVAALLLFTAFMGVLALPFIAVFEPTIFQLDRGSMALIVLSGILYMGATLFYLRALQFEEASAVSPFFQTIPLFGYGLAFFVLGERLSIVQIAGGALILVGTLIVSVRLDQNAHLFKLRLALLMLACGLAAAISGLIFKVFAIKVEFWTTTFWMFVGEAMFGAALLVAVGVALVTR